MNVKMKYGKVVHGIKSRWKTNSGDSAGDTLCDWPYSTHPIYGDKFTEEEMDCKRCLARREKR